MARIAVVGGGIVGCTTALLLADHGYSVDLFEREAELWSGASRAGEGKIHLGPIFALGGRATHEAQLREHSPSLPSSRAPSGARWTGKGSQPSGSSTW